jgi:hypothetical protein
VWQKIIRLSRELLGKNGAAQKRKKKALPRVHPDRIGVNAENRGHRGERKTEEESLTTTG